MTTLFACYGLVAATDWYLARWVGGVESEMSIGPIAGFVALSLGSMVMMIALNLVSGFAGAHASRNLHSACISHIMTYKQQ